MKTNNKRFLVYNLTDGIEAHPDLMMLAEARRFVRDFAGRFAVQGYYLTASRERMSPEDVSLEIVDTGAGPAFAEQFGLPSLHGGGHNE